MPLEKCGHVLVAHELAPSRLFARFPDCLTGVIIELYGPALLRNDRHENFGRLVLVGLGQLANLLDRLLEHLCHKNHYITPIRPCPQFLTRRNGEPARNILRLGNTRTLVSLNLEKPTGTVDHFAIGIPRYNKEAAVRYFTERGVKPLEGNFAGFHPRHLRVGIGDGGNDLGVEEAVFARGRCSDAPTR